MSAQSSAAAVPAVAAAGVSDVPYAEMALAGMVGRAMSVATGRSFKEWTGVIPRERPTQAPAPEPDSPSRSVTGVELVAALRGPWRTVTPWRNR